MLSLTTNKHHVFVTIPGINGCSDDQFQGYVTLIDNSIDALLDKCRADEALLGKIASSTSVREAYGFIGTLLQAVLPNYRWMREHVGSDLCRRVLFLLHPDRFGFETYGWIH